MQITLADEELQRYIDEEVKSGNYPSPEALIKAALLDFRQNAQMELDDDTIDALNRADEQFARGEGVDFEVVAANWRKRLEGQ